MEIDLRQVEILLKIFKILFLFIAVRLLINVSRKRPLNSNESLGNREIVMTMPKELYFLLWGFNLYVIFNFVVRYQIAIAQSRGLAPIYFLAAFILVIISASVWVFNHVIHREIRVHSGKMFVKKSFGQEKIINLASLGWIKYNHKLRSITIYSGYEKVRVDVFFIGFYDFINYLKEIVPPDKLNYEEYSKFCLLRK